MLIAAVILGATGITAASVDAASVSVSWNAPTTNADGTVLTDLAGYRLYIATSTPSCPGGSALTIASPTSAPSAGETVATRVTNLTAGTTYFARVSAFDASGNESACSAAASGIAKIDFSVAPSTSTSFGSVTVGTTVDRTFTLQNMSSSAISVSVTVAAPFSIVSGGSVALPAGASQLVTVRFTPTAAGTFAGNVNFSANGDTISRGVSGSATSTTTTNPVPVISSIAPATAVAGSAGLTLTVNGSGFVGASVVRWNGANRTTTFVSATQLKAAITTADLASAAAIPVTVFTPAPGGGTSGSTTFTITAAPVVLPAAPTSPTVTLLATDGSGATFTVAWGAVSGVASYGWVAAFSDGTASQQGSVTGVSFQLRMPYHASAAASGAFVCVRSVTAAGAQSIDQACKGFTVPARPPAPPVPTITSLSPATAIAGSAGFTLTVNGSGFVASSVVRWNGANRTTTFVSATQLRAAITTADLAAAAAIPVTVFTPAPGGGTSASKTFTVSGFAALPSAPSNPTVTLLVADSSGAAFTVAWGAVSGVASYRWIAAFSDGTASQQGSVAGVSFQLRMPYHASGAASSAFVCVRSVTAAGVQSVDQACKGFTVPARPPAPPVPTIVSLAPATAVAGSAGFTLTVNGSGFVTASVVRWNGASRTTTFVSATQLKAAITTADLASAAAIPVTVFTPAPGGGTSGSATFTITAAPVVPPAPPNPTVTLLAADGSGATFTVAWGAVSGVASYGWVAAFSDGSASQQGSVAGVSFQLRMPYHASGAARSAFVCVRSVTAAGAQSADQACSGFTVPAIP